MSWSGEIKNIQDGDIVTFVMKVQDENGFYLPAGSKPDSLYRKGWLDSGGIESTPQKQWNSG